MFLSRASTASRLSSTFLEPGAEAAGLHVPKGYLTSHCVTLRIRGIGAFVMTHSQTTTTHTEALLPKTWPSTADGKQRITVSSPSLKKFSFNYAKPMSLSSPTSYFVPSTSSSFNEENTMWLAVNMKSPHLHTEHCT